MTALGIIGLILGIIVMIVFAYWGLNAVPLSLLAGAVNCIFSLLHFILCFYMFCEYHG